MATEGERIVRLEAQLDGLREDVSELATQIGQARTRLHNLEGFAQAYLDTQKAARRSEDAQYRRLGNRIQLGGLLMAVAMVALTVVTILAHN